MIASFDMSERRGYRALPKAQAVYQIRNRETGERYIVASTNVHNRARTHCARLRNGHKPHHPRLREAVNRHGIESFVFEVLELVEGDWRQRDLREYTAINAVPRELLYNRMIAPYKVKNSAWAGGCDV